MLKCGAIGKTLQLDTLLCEVFVFFDICSYIKTRSYVMLCDLFPCNLSTVRVRYIPCIYLTTTSRDEALRERKWLH